MIFSWDAWNVEHISKHGVTTGEAEYVVKQARPPFPAESADGKMVVWGQTHDGRYLQVIFVHRSEEDVDYDSLTLKDLLSLEVSGSPVAYVIHAMELTSAMKRQYRRRKH